MTTLFPTEISFCYQINFVYSGNNVQTSYERFALIEKKPKQNQNAALYFPAN